jgi:hypothetical protein
MTRIVSSERSENRKLPGMVTPPTPDTTSSIISASERPEAAGVVPSEGEPEAYARFLEERRRVSMSVPSMKMSVPPIPGYVCYWFNDDEGRVEKALRSSYQFVETDEVALHDFSLAGDSTKTGNQDLGSRVSMLVGTTRHGQPMRAYLMKIREEIWRIDQKLGQERNDQVAAALKSGRLGAQSATAPADADFSNTYVGKNNITRSNVRFAATGQKPAI